MIGNQRKDRRIIFRNFIEIDGNIWFWGANYHALFYCPMDGGTAVKAYGVKRQSYTKEPLYGEVVRYNEKVIGVPFFANDIMIYNIHTKQANFVKIPIQNWENQLAETVGKFRDIAVYGKYLYLVGLCSSKVFKFDMEDEKIIDSVDLYQNMNIPFESRGVCFKWVLLYQNRLIIPSRAFNQIFVLNADDMSFGRYCIERQGVGFAAIAEGEENIWLAPYTKGEFVKISKRDGKYELVNHYPKDYNLTDSAGISCMAYCNGKIWVMPHKANKIISIRVEGKKSDIQIEDFSPYYVKADIHNEIVKYLFVQQKETILYCFCMESKTLLAYDTENHILNEFEYCISDYDFVEGHVENNICMREKDKEFEDFLKVIADWKNKTRENRSRISNGNQIYSSVKEYY